MTPIEIIIRVWYDKTTVKDEDDLLRALDREVHSAVENGLLSPSREEVVDTYEVDIE